MAIGIFKSLEFGGINSADYGVYITGKAVYNAPERAVEQVDIPGRNGAFLMDLGRFENIEVTYPCGIPGDDQTDFAEKISEFRNAILSKRGYQRLTDEYNPSEYRMASYVSGMEVEAVEGQQGTVGEFELTFNCKPQRWLTSGETAVTVADGDTLTNPTLFDSEPLLEVEGYGTIGFNGYLINLDSAVFGNVDAVGGVSYPDSNTVEINLNSSLYNSGDPITLSNIVSHSTSGNVNGWQFRFIYRGTGASVVLKNEYVSSTESGIVNSGSWTSIGSVNNQSGQLSATFTAGTSATGSASAIYNVYNYSGSSVAGQITVTLTVSYDADNEKVSITGSYSSSLASAYAADFYAPSLLTITADVIATSSKTYLGNPTYVDCELGEAYRKDGDVVSSLNQYIDLGSDLPKLAPGANTFTVDSTITDLTVTPRYWRV